MDHAPTACTDAGHDIPHGSAAQRPARTILLVDDEQAVRKMAALLLQRLGFRVLTAADGLEAVETLRSRAADVDLVLLDLAMPNMGGRQALCELRQIRPDVPVILWSGSDEHDAMGRFAGADLAGFIRKPFQLQDLLSKLNEALSLAVVS